MNLFTRLSQILDDDEWPNGIPPIVSRWRADKLVASMEKQNARVRQSAITLIAAERAIAREMGAFQKSNRSDSVVLERLSDEHDRALTIKSWVKQTLTELGAALRQARSFRSTIRRWECLAALRQAAASQRLFWSVYGRLGDMADEKLIMMNRAAFRSRAAPPLHNLASLGDNSM